MTELEGLYKAVASSNPQDIKNNLTKIPGIHQQEALDNALEKSITLAANPIIQNIRYLLKLGADPNGPSDDEGVPLSYAYSGGLYNIVELLLTAGANVNAKHSNVLEQAVKKGDLRYVVRFVDAGADINDRNRLLFTDNLLKLAENHPKIQKYLIAKGINTATPKLEKNLTHVNVATIEDFEYPDPAYKPGSSKDNIGGNGDVSLHIQDYSPKFVLVKGDTKNNQQLLKRHGGRYIAKLRGWIVPVSGRDNLAQEILQLTNLKSEMESGEIPTPTPTLTPTPTPTPTPDDLSIFIKELLEKSNVKRPKATQKKVIELYGPTGEYGFMTVAFTRPNLLKLENQMWDSVERYLMYKMYEGTFKSNAIKNAATLTEARKKFNTTSVSTAKTPKQLLLNQKLAPLATSKINPSYTQHKEQLFYKATRAKFEQHKSYLNKLLATDNLNIFTKNSYDIFGYEGNLLGNTLMKLRDEFGGKSFNPKEAVKTNCIVIEKYPGNKNFYVIRGDPSTETATEIRRIGTYKTKSGASIRGKLNLNLQGGPGWLIPENNYAEAKKLIFDTLPNDKKIQIVGKDWIKKQMKQIVGIAILFANFHGKDEVGPDDILFTVKDILGYTDSIGITNTPPAEEFKQLIWKYVEQEQAYISEAAIQLLWDFLSNMIIKLAEGIETYSQLQNVINNHELAILDTDIKVIEGLSERESVIVEAFIRLFKMLNKINNNESRACVTVVHMMTGKDHYQKIREIYAKKAKVQSTVEFPDEEMQFRRRFHIKSPHIKSVLEKLPAGIGKKCKLLLLTTLDYVMELEGDQAIAFNNLNLKLASGPYPSPTPAPALPPKSLTPIGEVEVKVEGAVESPAFEGTPVEMDAVVDADVDVDAV